MQFYWRCGICKEAIKGETPERELVEKWMDGRKGRFHKGCLGEQDKLLDEADRILKKIGKKH
jgi:hypothetical protein